MTFDVESRHIWGWFNVGTYGIKTDIINISTGEVDFEKAQDNAEIIKHYFHIFIPIGFNEAICMMHSYRGKGIKTLFHDIFSPQFRETTSLNIQMHPLAYDSAIEAWQQATTKELRVTKFTGISDLADQISGLGHDEQTLILKPPRGGTLGLLCDYFNPNSEQARIVEVLSELGSQIKTVVEIDGNKRTFTVGENASNSICQIDLGDGVLYESGSPEMTSMHNWIRVIINEYSITMYPNMELAL